MSGQRVLAFDTSNYTTSAAVADLSGNILADCRSLLKVRDGERGLRQSHALFQHVENLPGLLRRAVSDSGSRAENICAVAVSERPRPAEGSYMPVFRAGVSTAESIAAALGIPVYRYSHQEGHIAAVCGALDESVRMVSFHLSGGTGEILTTRGCRPVSLVGGVRDLSFGQLIDRAGVALGLGFPAGAALDRIVCSTVPFGSLTYSSRGNTKIKNPVTTSIHVDGAYVNLSGIETQILREIERLKEKGTEKSENDGSGQVILKKYGAAESPEEKLSGEEKRLTAELFCRIADALVRLSVNALQIADTDAILFAGGVSASSFLRYELEERLAGKGYRAVFGDPKMSSDNACGIARLGTAEYLREKQKHI